MLGAIVELKEHLTRRPGDNNFVFIGCKYQRGGCSAERSWLNRDMYRFLCGGFFFFFFLWEREGMRHAPSRLSADVEDSTRARQVGLKPLDGSALCPTP